MPEIPWCNKGFQASVGLEDRAKLQEMDMVLAPVWKAKCKEGFQAAVGLERSAKMTSGLADRSACTERSSKIIAGLADRSAGAERSAK